MKKLCNKKKKLLKWINLYRRLDTLKNNSGLMMTTKNWKKLTSYTGKSG